MATLPVSVLLNGGLITPNADGTLLHNGHLAHPNAKQQVVSVVGQALASLWYVAPEIGQGAGTNCGAGEDSDWVIS